MQKASSFPDTPATNLLPTMENIFYGLDHQKQGDNTIAKSPSIHYLYYCTLVLFMILGTGERIRHARRTAVDRSE
jgi:hypothetical protein